MIHFLLVDPYFHPDAANPNTTIAQNCGIKLAGNDFNHRVIGLVARQEIC